MASSPLPDSLAPQGSPLPSRNEAFFQLAVPSDPADVIVHLEDPVLIQRARRALAKSTPVYVSGRVIPEPAWFNPPWSFHVDPRSLQFRDAPESIQSFKTFHEVNRALALRRPGETDPLFLPRHTQLQREVPRADVLGAQE